MEQQPSDQKELLPLIDQQQPEETKEEVDPVAELGKRLYALEKAASIDNSERLRTDSGYALASQIHKRLRAIEELVVGDGTVPVLDNRRTISREQAADVSFLRRNKISLEDVSTGRVKIR